MVLNRRRFAQSLGVFIFVTCACTRSSAVCVENSNTRSLHQKSVQRAGPVRNGALESSRVVRHWKGSVGNVARNAVDSARLPLHRPRFFQGPVICFHGAEELSRFLGIIDTRSQRYHQPSESSEPAYGKKCPWTPCTARLTVKYSHYDRGQLMKRARLRVRELLPSSEISMNERSVRIYRQSNKTFLILFEFIQRCEYTKDHVAKDSSKSTFYQTLSWANTPERGCQNKLRVHPIQQAAMKLLLTVGSLCFCYFFFFADSLTSSPVL